MASIDFAVYTFNRSTQTEEFVMNGLSQEQANELAGRLRRIYPACDGQEWQGFDIRVKAEFEPSLVEIGVNLYFPGIVEPIGLSLSFLGQPDYTAVANLIKAAVIGEQPESWFTTTLDGSEEKAAAWRQEHMGIRFKAGQVTP